MAVQISTTVEFIQANTTTNAGFLLLPSTTALAGRLLTIKDTAGTFGLRPLTLSTIGNDRFEEGVNLKRLVEQFGYITLASDGISRWYTIDGTSMNTYTISTLTNTISLSTQSIQTSTASVSTFGFVDRNFNSVSTLYTRSTLLYLGSNVIGGSKCGPTQFIATMSGGTFTPLGISGLNVWLDAADYSSFSLVNGNGVRFWRDKSGNQRTAFQATPANQPILAQNILAGKTCVQFTAATTVLGLPPYGLNLIPPISVFILGRQTILGGEFLGFTAGNGIYFRPSAGFVAPFYTSYGVDFGSGAQRYMAASPGNTDTTSFHIQSFALPNAALGNYWFDGTLGDRTNGFTYNSASFQSAFPSIGAFNQTPGNDAMTGFIAEIIVYRALLTTQQVQQVEGYLAWKWGLTGNLPTTHPYKNSPP